MVKEYLALQFYSIIRKTVNEVLFNLFVSGRVTEYSLMVTTKDDAQVVHTDSFNTNENWDQPGQLFLYQEQVKL